MPSDEMIIAMAGLGGFLTGYAGVSVTVQALQSVANISDKAGNTFLKLANRNPIEQILDRAGIGIIPNPTPVKGMANNNWWLERKTGLGTQDIGALGLGLLAGAALMWEMKHPTSVTRAEYEVKMLRNQLEYQEKLSTNTNMMIPPQLEKKANKSEIVQFFKDHPEAVTALIAVGTPAALAFLAWAFPVPPPPL